MPAMHDIVLANMESILSEKCELMKKTLHFEMTHDECLHLTVNPRHHEMLKLAAVVAYVSVSELWISLEAPAVVDGVSDPEVRLQMRTHAQKEPPLAPRSPTWQGAYDPVAFAAGEKIIAWMQRRYELGRKFAACREVVRWLAVNCDDGHQVRYMFPAVLHLCKAGISDKMDRWINKYSAFKPCKHTPAVSPQLKRHMQDAGALLTSVSLIGEDIPEATRTEVLIDTSPPSEMPVFDFDGRNVRRM